eukprot:TRINITY_DN3233_c3_g2_i1.p1 TRINITY_DN3233_c3_g2~~TRINITY_DN3233_c3_g2_i1.p1  ORF type:complete len:401 (+),score=89.76 TRINITY_DN3233_c3_g2_i1:93-1295(+)
MAVNLDVELIEKTIHDMFPQKIEECSSTEIVDTFTSYMYDCCYLLNGKYFVICGSSEAQIFDAETGILHHTLKDHTNSIFGLAVSPDGKKLATCSGDMSIIVYDLCDFSICCTLSNSTYVFGICFSPCSNFIYSGDLDGTLKKWEIKKESVILEDKIHFSWIWRIKLSSNGKYLLSASGDKTAKMIDLDKWSIISTFNHDGFIRCIDFHPNKRIVAIGDESNYVKLWDIDSGLSLYSIQMSGEVWSLHFLAPNFLFIMSGNGFIASYNVDSFQEIQRISCGCKGSSFSFALSPDGSQLVCGKCKANSVKLYPIMPEYHPSQQSELIELSKNDGHVLGILIAMNFNTQIVRQLVTAGIHINEKEFGMIFDTCWDLVDINETNGGNMYTFADTLDEPSVDID